MSDQPTWPEYAAALEQELDLLEDELTASDTAHEEPISPVGEFPDEPLPPYLRERIAVLAQRLERASALVAAQMIEVSSRPASAAKASFPMFIDQRL